MNNKRLQNIEAVLAKESLKAKADHVKNKDKSFNPEAFLNSGPLYEDLKCDLTNTPSSTKVMAYYLPQFYSFKENNEWWGNGFTEWQNVTRGRPRFDAHYQPRLPKDLGYYDLKRTEVMHIQAELARKAGLHSWCFYYYRFGNKRLLDLPINNFLAEPNIDINFSLMWANESWSRTWTEQSNEILIEQHHDPKYDIETIDDLARHFIDPRYMRVNGKPLFYIYRPSNIPNAKQRIEAWRELLWSRHSIEVNFQMAQVFGDRDPRPYGLDGAIEFPPHNLSSQTDVMADKLPGKSAEFSGRMMHYDTLIRRSLALAHPEYDLIKCITPNWDNEPRKPNSGLGYHGSTPAKYQSWLEEIISYSQEHTVQGESIVCINAWNEWAEGAYLEPDIYYGSAYLNATARALSK